MRAFGVGKRIYIVLARNQESADPLAQRHSIVEGFLLSAWRPGRGRQTIGTTHHTLVTADLDS